MPTFTAAISPTPVAKIEAVLATSPFLCEIWYRMLKHLTFQRRGIVEGFFGPPWSMSHRAALFEFGAKRGMNTYL